MALKLHHLHRRAAAQLRPHLPLLPLLGIVPSFLLAAYGLTQPWAKAKVLLMWGVSRSPGAALLVVVTLAGMVAASVTVAARARRLTAASVVHMITGLLMCGVSFVAYRLVRRSGVRLFGLLNLASVKPARGLHYFLAASILVSVLGVVELVVSSWRAGRRPEAAEAPASEKSGPGAAASP